jgi:hypothetical protein
MKDMRPFATPANAQAAKELRRNTRPAARIDCPTLLRVPVDEVLRRNPGKRFFDMTGKTFGSASVVGLVSWKGEGCSLWAMHCGCGLFQLEQHHWLENLMKMSREWSCASCRLKDGRRI